MYNFKHFNKEKDMSKLTAHQIGFISKYLKNSGVQYTDIRYEMTDHVAAALEEMDGDFYDNFTQYMLLHKKELLESNKQFSRIARNNAFKLVFYNFIRSRGLLILALFFNIGLLLTLYTDTAAVIDFYQVSYSVLFIIMGVAYLKMNLFKTEKIWSGTDKLLGTFMSFMYLLTIIVRVDKFTDTEPLLVLYYSVLMSLIIAVFISYRQLTKKYNLQFNG
jgi:hypothetical protein